MPTRVYLLHRLNTIGTRAIIISEVETLKKYVWWTIIWLPSVLEDLEIMRRCHSLNSRIVDFISDITTIGTSNKHIATEGTINKLVADCMSTLREIANRGKALYHNGEGEVFYSGIFEKLLLVQRETLCSNEHAIIAVRNIRSYLDHSKHLKKVCVVEHELLKMIRDHALLVAVNTSKFLYSCWVEPETNHDLKLTRLLQMVDPTNPNTSRFCLRLFNLLRLSKDSPLADEHEIDFIDLLLYSTSQIMHCQEEYQATSVLPSILEYKLEKLHVYVTLMKDIVPYSALAEENLFRKVALHKSIMTSAITVPSFSFCKDSEEKAFMENNLALLGAPGEIFNRIAEELDKAGVRDHLLSDRVTRFVDDMVDFQQDLLSFSEQALISVQHLRSYLDISKHLANACVNEDAVLTRIWYRAQVISDYTAKFLYWCWAEPATDLDLKLIHLLQMNDPTNPDANGFYLQILNSLSLSDDSPSADEHGMNSIDHLLLHLKSRIIHYQDCEATSVSKEQLETIHAYVELVKDIVLYSPLSVQNMSSKITLHENIIKCAITVSSFSSAKKSEANAPEENNIALLGALNESFNKIAAELVKVSFIDHLFLHLKKQISNCQSRSIVHSLKGQLEKFSEYMTLFKVIVAFEPLRNMFSKVILQKVIVKFMIIISPLASIDIAEEEVKDHKTWCKGIKNFFDVLFSVCINKTEEEEVKDHTRTGKNLEFLPNFGVTNLIEEYLKFKADELNDLHVDMKYEVNGEQAIGQYIDSLVEVQKQYLSTNKQAIISVQNLRTLQHLSKILVNWYNDEDMLNNLMHHLLIVVEHTSIFLLSCWIEPETNHELKLTDLLHMTIMKNPMVQSIYVHRFKSSRQSEYSPWRDELSVFSFIDLLILSLKELKQYETKSIVVALKERMENHHRYLSDMTKIVRSFSFAKNSEENSGEQKNLALLGALEESFYILAAEILKAGFIDHLFLCFKKQISNYQSRSIVHSLKGQLEKFSEYMTLFKVIVSYPPLRYMFSKIMLQKVIVRFVTFITSLASIDLGEVEDDRGKEDNIVFSTEPDLTNLIEEYLKFTADGNQEIKELHDLHVDMKYEVNGEQVIEQYIDGLAEVQKQYLSTNKQAIISVQNLRTFQHLGKVLVGWYNDEDMLNNLMRHLLIVVEHTSIFLLSCWIEPEMNPELKLTDLLNMTSIKNPMVESIYVHGFKSLRHSEYSPWPDELSVFSFIDHLILYLKELMQCENRSLKEKLENLHSYLTDLRKMVAVKDIVPFSRDQYMPSSMKSFHSLVINFGMSMSRFSINDSREDAEKKNLVLIRELEENISLMKVELRKSFTFACPSICGELFSILKNLEDLLTFRTDVIAPLKYQLERVYTDLPKLISFLDKIKGKPVDENKELQSIWQRVIQVSHGADFIIQSYVNRDGPTYYHALQLSVVLEDIQLLITEIGGLGTETSSYNTEKETYNQGSSERSKPNITDMVGFEDASERILRQLNGTSKKLKIVAIVGMPGLGKTTIAKNVYDHPSVANHFDRRGWCCVSQSYQEKELLLQILRSITVVNNDQISKKSHGEIGDELWKCLRRHRYLIVLDDIWETKVWKKLNRSFPDDNNGSRVIITSRAKSVSEELSQATVDSYVHPLRQFHDNESYKLLIQKLSPQHVFPDSGLMIAKNCKGLPLTVVLAAGILSRMEKNEAHWIKFAESLSKQIVNEEGNQCKNLIELSYTHLPDHLKCSFLYFGAFPEDKEISAKKLAWLWIAEGFVRGSNLERLEDIAENYLMDLIGRSLVIGSKSASRPGIKSCRVHDLLHEFCLAKSEEENFLQVVRGYDKYLPSDNIHFDFGVDPRHAKGPSKITHGQYRLSIYSKRKHFISVKPSGPNVRTLFFHDLADMHPNFCRYDASFVSRYFKLIKVLDFGSINNTGKSLTGVVSKLHLRYLEGKGNIESIPISKENLWNLQTFILKGTGVAATTVPNSIWSLPRLRHLHIDGYTSIKFDTKEIADSTILADMESFSTPTISYGDDVEEMLHRFPKLRKLKCIFLDSWDYLMKCNRLPELKFLTQLVSLKVSWHCKSSHPFRRYPCRFSFPSNLTKLTLSEFALPWSEISAIGKLPNLNALKLLSNAFTGEKWDMSEGEFPSLNYLELESLDIEEWIATDEHIPKLQRLVLCDCKKLKEIPSEIGYIDRLEIIEVRWCSSSATDSVTIIQKIANNEYGSGTLKVHIYRNEKNLHTSF